MPKLGMEMTTGTVASWFIKEGTPVVRGSAVLEIETEKIAYEVEAPASGILRKILIHEGEMGHVGEVLGVITDQDEAWDEREFLQQKSQPELTAAEESRTTPSHAEVAAPFPTEPTRVVATPAARRLAREKGVDLTRVSGTSSGGRITERDVLAALEAPSRPAEEMPKQIAPLLGTTIPLPRMRKIIGERLTRSWESPHIYLMAEVHAGELVNLRKDLLAPIESEIGKRLTYDDILIKIVAATIEKFPLLNALLEGDQIRIPGEINLGLAVALDDGLVVPVVRRANEKTLREIVRIRADLVERSRRRKLALDELRGSTFSITNLGMFEVDFFTAILNPPETGILAVGRIKDGVRVVGGAIRVRPVMKLVLGVDHRVVDGAIAAAFLQEIKRKLENPGEIFPTG